MLYGIVSQLMWKSEFISAIHHFLCVHWTRIECFCRFMSSGEDISSSSETYLRTMTPALAFMSSRLKANQISGMLVSRAQQTPRCINLFLLMQSMLPDVAKLKRVNNLFKSLSTLLILLSFQKPSPPNIIINSL